MLFESNRERVKRFKFQHSVAILQFFQGIYCYLILFLISFFLAKRNGNRKMEREKWKNNKKEIEKMGRRLWVAKFTLDVQVPLTLGSSLPYSKLGNLLL